MQRAFSRFTRLPASLREAAAFVTSRTDACWGWAARLPCGADFCSLSAEILHRGLEELHVIFARDVFVESRADTLRMAHLAEDAAVW